MVDVSRDEWKFEQSQGARSELWDLNKGQDRSLVGGGLQWLRGRVARKTPGGQRDHRCLGVLVVLSGEQRPDQESPSRKMETS